MEKKERKRLFFLLKLLFSTGVLTLLLVFRTSPADIVHTLKGIDPVWLMVSFSLHALGLLISAVRWQILIKAQNDSAPLGFLIKSYMVGTFFNNFLPSRIGGDIVRIWDGSKSSRSLVKSSAVILVERLTGIGILLLFALGASLFRLDMARRIPVIWISLLIGTLGLVTIFSFFSPLTGRLLKLIPEKGLFKSLKRKIFSFRETTLSFRSRKQALLKASAWALLLQVNVILHFFLIGKALHLHIHFLDYFIFIPIVLLIQLIPITINGLGLREGSYIEIFRFYGISPEAAFSFALVDVAFMLLIGIAGGIIYITRK